MCWRERERGQWECKDEGDQCEDYQLDSLTWEKSCKYHRTDGNVRMYASHFISQSYHRVLMIVTTRTYTLTWSWHKADESQQWQRWWCNENTPQLHADYHHCHDNLVSHYFSLSILLWPIEAKFVHSMEWYIKLKKKEKNGHMKNGGKK